MVGQGTVCPVQEKIQAISCYHVHATKTELMRLLDLVGDYKSFCRIYSEVVAPLTNLLKGKMPFVWTPVDSVKQVLRGAPVFATPWFERPFSLQVDASHVGAGAVLLQADDRGTLKRLTPLS